MLKKLIRALLILLILGLAGCFNTQPGNTSLTPPSGFQDADLSGTWKTVGDVYADEMLTLNNDGSFSQVYDNLQTKYHYRSQGIWQTEYRSSGCVYVYLQGMRYFHSTQSIAERGNRYPDNSPVTFQEPCEQRSITMPDEVILTVRGNPSFPRGIMLEFPRMSSESTDVIMRLDLHP